MPETLPALSLLVGFATPKCLRSFSDSFLRLMVKGRYKPPTHSLRITYGMLEAWTFNLCVSKVLL